MDFKERKKKYLKKASMLTRILVFLGIYRIWFESRRNKLPPYICERFNVFNPLTWILILCIWIGYICKSVFYDYWKQVCEYLFKVTKTY